MGPALQSQLIAPNRLWRDSCSYPGRRAPFHFGCGQYLNVEKGENRHRESATVAELRKGTAYFPSVVMCQQAGRTTTPLYPPFVT